METLEQKTQEKVNSVQDRKAQEKSFGLSSDRTMKLEDYFNVSVNSELSSISEGQKKILLLKFKHYISVTKWKDPKEKNNEQEERLPEEILAELETYIEKLRKAGSSHPQRKSPITRRMYELFQLCAGLGIQRNLELKTKQLSLLYFLLYYFSLQVKDISPRQFTKQRFFKYIDENKDFLSSTSRNEFEEDFVVIKDIAEYFYSRALYLDSSKGEQTYSYLNFTRFINEDMFQTYQKMNWKKKYTVVDFYCDRKSDRENYFAHSIDQYNRK